MKNDLTTKEWLALSEALKYINQVAFCEACGDILSDYEKAVEKVENVADYLKSRR